MSVLVDSSVWIDYFKGTDTAFELEVECLKKGINGVGIPDFIIACNAIENNCKVYSHDKHFKFLSQISDVNLYGCHDQ
jgi:predicted nucleic acid-binding protein